MGLPGDLPSRGSTTSHSPTSSAVKGSMRPDSDVDVAIHLGDDGEDGGTGPGHAADGRTAVERVEIAERAGFALSNDISVDDMSPEMLSSRLPPAPRVRGGI